MLSTDDAFFNEHLKIISSRPSAVRASWQTLVSYDQVRLLRTAGFNARPAAVYCCWRADPSHTMCHTTSSPNDTQLLVSMDSTNATPTIDRLAHCSAAVRLWFLQNSTLTSQRWSFSVPLLSSGQLPTSPPSTLPEALCRSHRSSSRFVRLSREKRCKGLQLPHSSSAPRAQSTD